MEEILLKVRIAASRLEESLPGLGKDWAGPTKKSAPKTYKKLKQALPDIDTVIEKIIKPRIETQKRMFKQDPARPVPGL